ncbi:MAG: hypothetical protein KDN05_15660, partial [Verrucomicrobiae bacterium]|nr:hypothetical protein [Verrucomicrobiae bacterium]
LNIENCRILNPYGTNTSEVWRLWGGGQQITMSAWVGTASYTDCVFEGGGDDMTDSYRAPAGRMKDGCHFGSPMRFIFHRNQVRRMGYESVYQTNRCTYMGTTKTNFTIPAADATTTATMTLYKISSTFEPGQLLNFRVPTSASGAGRNYLLRVHSWDPVTQQLTIVNDRPSNVAGTVLGNPLPIYLQADDQGIVDIRDNFIDGALPPGAEDTNSSGIVTDTRGVIANNAISGCATGILNYFEVTIPLFPGTRGIQIKDNLIVMRHPDLSAGPVTYGIQTPANQAMVARNHIVCPLSRRSTGIALRGTGTRVVGNRVSATEQMINGYFSSQRSVGILVGNESDGTRIDGNTTRQFDVGVGPEPSQGVKHSVTRHTSIGDIYPIDKAGLVDP